MNQRQDFHLDRMELFYAEKYRELADHVKADIQQVSPHTVVNLVPMELANPWDFSEVYTKLHDWAASYPFDTEEETYLTHITTRHTRLPKSACFYWWNRVKSPAYFYKPPLPKTKDAVWRTAMSAVMNHRFRLGSLRRTGRTPCRCTR